MGITRRFCRKKIIKEGPSAGLERKDNESGEDRGFAEGEVAHEKTLVRVTTARQTVAVHVYPKGESVL
jgi:hypothetical protein